MDRICLFGGGRWSRVWLSVLTREYPHLFIIWITKHNYALNLQWLKVQNISTVKIVEAEEEAWEANPEAAIVASASHLHVKHTRAALLQRIPVLCEKPCCFSMAEAEQLIALSQEPSVPLGVNFEFMYASYLHSFAQQLIGMPISSINIAWQDAISETRYGEQKMGDIYTPLMYDSFQHCWSVLKFLFPKDQLTINKLRFDLDSSVEVDAELGSKQVTIALSRRAPRRVRKLSINNDAVVLDFSLEPGVTTIDGRTIDNVWQGARPLRAVFDSFVAAINNPAFLLQWSLNLFNCLEVISLSAQATELLEQLQLSYLEHRRPFTVDDAYTRNLLVDIFLPKLTAAGEYYRAHNLHEQIEFSKQMIRRFCSDCMVTC